MEDRYTLADIKAANTAAGHYFFSPDTMRFFGDRMTSFAVRHIGGRVFIERTKPSPKAPDAAMARACVGELREFDPETGHIGVKLHGEALAEVEDLRDLYAQGYRAHVVRNGWTVVRSRDGYESGKMTDARRAWAMALKDCRYRAEREA